MNTLNFMGVFSSSGNSVGECSPVFSFNNILGSRTMKEMPPCYYLWSIVDFLFS